MHLNSRSHLPHILAALLLIAAPVAQAKDGGGKGSSGRSHSGRGGGGHDSGSGYAKHGGGGKYSNHGYAREGGGGKGFNRDYDAPNRGFYNNGGRKHSSGHRYAYSPRGFSAGYSSGRFYAGRGYFYGGNFWARPFFGIGIGIPFGYGYPTNRGCGYVDGYGDFWPAPCYSDYYFGY